MTNESYAEHLCVSLRTVANWRGNPGVIPRPSVQDILDAALERAPDRVKAQFALLIGEAKSGNQEAGHVESFAASLNAAGSAEIEGSELLESINSHIHEIVALDNRFGGADLSGFPRDFSGICAINSARVVMTPDLSATCTLRRES